MTNAQGYITKLALNNLLTCLDEIGGGKNSGANLMLARTVGYQSLNFQALHYPLPMYEFPDFADYLDSAHFPCR